MNKLDKVYTDLLQDILDNGSAKGDRTGTGTVSVFGRQIRHKMSEGFPLLTTKKMPFKTITTELLWFLRGDTNIKYLVDNNCNIWNGDAYKRFTYYTDEETSMERFIGLIKTDDEFAKKWGELGPIYGKQWRSWRKPNHIKEGGTYYSEIGNFNNFRQDIYNEYKSHFEIDQIANLINDLKTNPDSRRLMVNAWAVHDLPNMVLPPCHYGFQVYTRELSREERSDYYYKNGDKEGIVEGSLDRPIWEDNETAHIWYDERNVPKRAISLMFNMRSNDVPLGLPFNIASYALLLEIISKMVNMISDELIANLGDAHIYKNQVDGVKEQLTRTPMKLPNLIISDDVNFNGTIDDFLESCDMDSFKLDGYESHPSIKIPLSN